MVSSIDINTKMYHDFLSKLKFMHRISLVITAKYHTAMKKLSKRSSDLSTRIVPLAKDIGICVENIISKIPPIQNLFETINVMYGNPPQQSDSVRVFGGFLRWIVETLSDVKMPSLVGFLATRADIDIQVRRYRGCAATLSEWFARTIKLGCVIEYAGMVYGGSELVQVNIDPSSKTVQPGNYIVYIPYVIINAQIPENLKNMYLRVDVIYDCNESTTDFSANSLQYPSNRKDDAQRQAIEDIAARRLFRISTEITPKAVYRALKLLRRGYKFLSETSFWQMCHIAMSDELRSKRRISKGRALRQRDLIQYAFTTNMSEPTITSTNILTTKHPITKIDNEFLLSQQDFRTFFDRADPIYKNKTPLYPFMVSTAMEKAEGIESTDKTKETKETKETADNIRVLGADTIVHKLCDLVHFDSGDYSNYQEDSKQIRYNVCIALRIPAGTEYVCESDGYAVYRFACAIVHAVYAYPNIDITKVIRGKLVKRYTAKPEGGEFNDSWHAEGKHPLQVRSKFDPSFTYSLDKVLSAKTGRGSNNRANLMDCRYGIYAYINLDTAWSHSHSNRILFESEIPYIKKLVECVEV